MAAQWQYIIKFETYQINHCTEYVVCNIDICKLWRINISVHYKFIEVFTILYLLTYYLLIKVQGCTSIRLLKGNFVFFVS